MANIEFQGVSPAVLARDYVAAARAPVDPRAAPYNCAWDGATDDRVGFQSAMNDAYTQGRALLVPRGTAVVTPDSGTGYCFTLPGGIVFQPEAGRDSIIKVKSGAGNYDAVFYGSADCTGLRVSGFTIDSNNRGNTATASAGSLVGGVRRPMVVLAGSDIRVESMAFLDWDANNVVYVRVTGTRGVWVRDNVMETSAVTAHDSSAVYVDAPNQTVTGNTIVSTTTGSPAARCGLEIHGGPFTVHSNVVKGFTFGSNLCSSTLLNAGTGTFHDNTLVGVARGIALWPFTATGFGLDAVDIHDNIITVDHAAWSAAGWTCGALTIAAGNNAPIRNLRVNGNLARLVSISGTIAASDYQSAQVYLYRAAGVGDIDWRIEDNVLDGAVSACIYVDVASITRLRVRRNDCVDPAQGAPSAAYSTAYNYGIIVGHDLADVRVDENSIIDTAATHNILAGVRLTDASNCVSVRALENGVRASDGTALPHVNGPAATTPVLVRHLTASWAAPTGNFGTGSEVTDATTGLVRRITTTPQASTWLRILSNRTVPAGTAAGGNSGSSAPAPVVSGTDDTGTVTFGTGTGPSAGAMALVSFRNSWSGLGTPVVMITPTNAAAAALGLYVSSISSANFVVSAANAPAASQTNTTYAFAYSVRAV